MGICYRPVESVWKYLMFTFARIMEMRTDWMTDSSVYMGQFSYIGAIAESWGAATEVGFEIPNGKCQKSE